MINFNSFRQIYSVIPSNQNYKFYILFILIVVGTILEMLSFGIIIPIIGFLFNPDNQYTLKIIEFTNLNNEKIILYSLIFLILIFFIKSLYMSFLTWYQASSLWGLVRTISRKLLLHYVNLPFDQQLSENSSIKIRNITTEITQFSITYLNQIFYCIIDIFLILVISGIVLFINPIGSIIAISVFILFFLCIDIYSKKKIRNWSIVRQNANGNILKNLNDIFRGIREIKSRSLENEFINLQDEFLKKTSTVSSLHETFTRMLRFWFEFIAIMSILAFAYYHYFYQSFNSSLIEELAIFGIAFIKLLPTINRLSSSINVIRFTKVSLDVISKELEMATTKKEGKRKFKNNISFKNIIFDKISYEYPSKNSDVLNSISLTINKNDCIGIKGKSGSGKSTFLDLFIGLLKSQNGTILVNDKKIEIYDNKKWQSIISYIPQETFLIDDTIYKNINLFNKYKDTKLDKILYDLNLKSLIQGLDEGINTNIGERGLKFSGGQKQRLGIARALIQNTQIIIFDESTSALDAFNENRILDLIKKLKNEKTIIIVSHREKMFKECNKIFEIKNKSILKK